MTRLSILILGIGGMGEKHLKAFAETQRCNIYCFDSNPAALDKIKKKFTVSGIFSDLRQICTNLINGAIIATPTDTHLQYANWCLEHGIHFLIEKPIAIREEGLKQLIDSCNAKKLLTGVAYPRRSSAGIKELKNRVTNGEIGDLKLIRSNFSQDFRKYRPDYRSIYYAKSNTGGGVMMDALSHHINLVCYFGGKVAQVSALYDKLIFEGVEGEDCAFINLRFRSGVMGAVHGNQFQKPNEDFIELVGSDGNLKYERITGILMWSKSDSTEWKQTSIDGNWNEILRMQANEFIDTLNGHGTLKTSLEEGLHNLSVVLGAKSSQEKKETIRIIE